MHDSFQNQQHKFQADSLRSCIGQLPAFLGYPSFQESSPSVKKVSHTEDYVSKDCISGCFVDFQVGMHIREYMKYSEMG